MFKSDLKGSTSFFLSFACFLTASSAGPFFFLRNWGQL